MVNNTNNVADSICQGALCNIKLFNNNVNRNWTIFRNFAKNKTRAMSSNNHDNDGGDFFYYYYCNPPTRHE